MYATPVGCAGTAAQAVGLGRADMGPNLIIVNLCSTACMNSGSGQYRAGAEGDLAVPILDLHQIH